MLESDKIYPSNFEMYMDQFCTENNIDSLSAVHPNIWNAVLIYVYQNTFANNKSTIQESNGYYKADVLETVCDIYIYLCYKYGKIPSITGFCFLTGIDNNTVREWNEESSSLWRNGNGGKILSKAHNRIYKKLSENREEGLQNHLLSGKVNPVGTLAVLNHFYGWNMPGVRDNKKEVVLISRNEIENALENNRSAAAIEPPKL